MLRARSHPRPNACTHFVAFQLGSDWNSGCMIQTMACMVVRPDEVRLCVTVDVSSTRLN